MKLGAYAARTDPGRKRRGNEDSYVSRPPLFAIADGMGGARAGEVASALAAGALKESEAGRGGEAYVVELIQEANRRVHERASTDAETSGMGTTITVALIENDGTVTMGHVGDSRAYLLRGDRLEQLTDDHSLVAELVRRGELSPQAAEVHPQRSVITRALGTDPDVDVDAFSVDVQAGDLFLICSDGLSDMVDAEEIEAVLKGHRSDLDAAAKALVQAANRARRRGQHHGAPLRARRRRAHRAGRTDPGARGPDRRRGHAASRGRHRPAVAHERSCPGPGGHDGRGRRRHRRGRRSP